jgi:DNA invertase Pin-like site-specific DNA recombinase
VETNTSTRSLRVTLYACVSTRDKDQDPELQLQPMRAYAVARGWPATEYIDRAAAGDLAGRAAWARLLEDVRRRRVDHVLAWKLDRPFRSTLQCAQTLEELEHRGVV